MAPPTNGATVPLIDKERLPRVDLEFMNDVHLEEVDIVNDLSELLDAYGDEGSSLRQISDKFDDLIEHTKNHFAGEERLMIEGEFPPYPMHKNEHLRQLQRVAAVHANWTDTRDVEALRQFVQDELPEWVNNHILTMDTVTAQYLSASGQMPGY